MPTELAYALSSEEHDARTLIATAQQAEQAGFRSVWISDHFHPWIDRQGQSPFVWSVIGGIAATTDLRVTTAVTCPTTRIHPAIVAQAAATSSNLLPDGRFVLGVGSGEALNEHVLGDRWPPADLRLDQLREAIEVIRKLWTGDQVTHRGDHYTVENARLYTRPSGPVPVVVSAYGPLALRLAAEHGDGWMTTSPDAAMLDRYRELGGKGRSHGQLKACWGPDEDAARRLAHEIWPTSGVPGQLHQDLPTPAHFEQAAAKVSVADATDGTPCGPDPERYVEQVRPFVEAGFDEVSIAQIGPDQQGFFRFYEDELRDRFERLVA